MRSVRRLTSNGTHNVDSLDSKDLSPPKALAGGWHILVQTVIAVLVFLSLGSVVGQLVRRGIHSFGAPAPWGWLLVSGLIVGLLFAWGYLADDIYAAHHTSLTPDGVLQRRLLRGDRYLTWGEVRQISAGSGFLVLKGARGKITISGFCFREPQVAGDYVLTQLRRAGSRGGAPAA